MPTIYQQFQDLNGAEKAYLRNHPHHVLALKESRSAAFAETQRRFGKNARNDKSDAFRHCFWSALLARELGYVNALAFTSAHENFPGNNIKEKQMDLHNNRAGLDIGRNKGSNAQLSTRCMAALQSGKLKIMVK